MVYYISVISSWEPEDGLIRKLKLVAALRFPITICVVFNGCLSVSLNRK